MRTLALALASLAACCTRSERVVSGGLPSSPHEESKSPLRALAKFILVAKNPAAWHAAWPVTKHRCNIFPDQPSCQSAKLRLSPHPIWISSMANGRTLASRSAGVMMRQQLDEFERGALAGLWSGMLDLDDGVQMLTCQLRESGACTAATNGTSTAGSSKSAWEAQVKQVEQGTTRLKMKVWVGDLLLTGEGTRDPDSLRCRSVEGIVLEGQDEPVYVGRFVLNLTLPSAEGDQLAKLEAQHKRRLDSRPTPSRFRLGAFVGRWKLLLAFDTSPTLFTVELDEDGRFTSIMSGNQRLGGSWGVFDAVRWRDGDTNIKRKVNQGFGIETPLMGTHLLLRVERRKCVGLPQVQQSYSLWGKPELSTPHAEIVAKSPGGSGYVDSVNGHCYLGASSDRDWFLTGRFSLERDV